VNDSGALASREAVVCVRISCSIRILREAICIRSGIACLTEAALSCFCSGAEAKAAESPPSFPEQDSMALSGSRRSHALVFYPTG
jgi:hypothetical protein